LDVKSDKIEYRCKAKDLFCQISSSGERVECGRNLVQNEIL